MLGNLLPSLCLSFLLLITAVHASSLSLDELTISQLHDRYQSKKVTVTSVTQAYLQRIEQQNHQGPTLNAVISLNPDALKRAKQLDHQLTLHHDSLPVLFGVPVLIKDNVETKDSMPTSAGSLALKDNFAQEDATLIKNLREAGAIILGKTNLSEWANFRSTHSSSGWSALGGQTRNPYVLSRSSCGSSSGTGSAIAANWALIGIGTETDGSIVCPASANGLVGVKPTLGLVSRTGVIPLAHSQDTAGPMTRTVTDAAILLSVMISKDNKDKITLSQPAQRPNYLTHLTKEGLKGKRIGVINHPFHLQRDTAPLYQAALSQLEKQGATLIKDLAINTTEEMDNAEYDVLLYEFKHGINHYLEQQSLPYKSLTDLIAFNTKNRAQQMPYFDQEIFLAAEQKGPLTDEQYQQALANNGPAMRKLIDDLMQKHQLDLLVMPTLNPSWNIDLINGDHYTGSSSSYAAVSGYPSITLPMGFVHELPVGISFVATAYQEALLFEAAYAYEQSTQHRKAPKFIPSLIQ